MKIEDWINKIAYLAGIVDGEGSIMIRKSTYRSKNKKYGDCVNPSYSPRVGIKNICKNPLLLMKNVFGGHVSKEKRLYQSKSGFKRKNLMWIYNAEHRIAYKICEALFPYLMIKREQAKKIFELKRLKGLAHKDRQKDNSRFCGKAYKKCYIEQFEKLYLEVKKLNAH